MTLRRERRDRPAQSRLAGKNISLYKVVVLGDGGVGKTALTIQTVKLCLQHFVETYDPTIEDSYRKQVVIDGMGCMLEILDTAGQEEYTALRAQWIRDGEAFLIVYSISSRSSFTRIQLFHKQILRVKEEAAPFSMGQGPPIMLVGNKCDRVTEREVSTQEGHALARELGISFVEASAKNCINVEKSAYDVVRELRRERLRAGSNGVSSPSPGLPIKKTFWGGYKIPFLAEEKNTEKGRTKLLQGLVHSAKTNNEKALIAYIEAGADINGHLGSDGSALHASAAGGYSNIVNILLKNGAAMNALSPAGVPPLQVAAAEGHLAVVRLLLHKGAIIDQTSTLHGTALMAAASRGRAEVAHFLLKSRATVNISGGRYGNALQAAAWNGNPEVVEHLLDAGADINARGGGDCTALQMAAFVGKHKVIRVLLNRGADITINAPGGKYGTALKAANDGGHYEAVTLLLDSGGKDTPDEVEVLKKNEQLQSSSSLQTDSHQDHETLTQRIGASDSSLLLETQYAKSPRNSDSQVQVEPTLTGSFIRNEILTTSKSPKTTSGQHLKRHVHSVGFSTLLDTPTAVVDIVFVHGLQGHPEKTWKYSGEEARQGSRLSRRFFRSMSTPHTETISPVFWPYDLLAHSADFANTRIMTWGYDTKVVKEFFGSSDQQNISQHGNNLLVCLQQERKSDPSRPLIFVCHSLGGIIVKVALENSRKSAHQPQYLSIYQSTRGILFFGTPHGGSRTADWGLLASNITKCALQNPSQKVLRSLNPNSELLENLRKSFLQMLEDGHFNIHSFYETRAVSSYGLNSLVVPFESALVGHAKKETSLGLAGSHLEICRFSSIDDPGYRAVFGALQDYVNEIARTSDDQSGE